VRHEQTSRTQPRTDLDLALERTGTVRGISAEDREAVVRVALIADCPIAADHILADAHRRRLIAAAPEPARRPGPRPRQTAPRPPLLRLIVNSGEVACEVDDRASFYLRMALVAEEVLDADWPEISERADWMRSARDLRSAAFEHLAGPTEPPPSPSAA
jgi:hypothetical protein